MPATREEIIQRLEGIDNLPTLPAVMNRLTEALNNPECCASDVVRVLVNDVSISAQILKTVNSPIFSTGGPKVDDLQTAIARLGFREVRNIALSTSVFQMFDAVESRLFDRQEFWRHCLSTSLAASEIGKLAGFALKMDELHLAGLVHDIGKIILDAEFTDLFEQSLGLALQKDLPLYQAEQVVMEIDHSEVGAILAAGWNLPEVATAAIRYHHEIKGCPDETKPVLHVVSLANYIVNTQDLGTGGDSARPVFCRESWEALALTAEDIQCVVRTVNEKSSELADFF